MSLSRLLFGGLVLVVAYEYLCFIKFFLNSVGKFAPELAAYLAFITNFAVIIKT